MQSVMHNNEATIGAKTRSRDLVTPSDSLVATHDCLLLCILCLS